MQARRVSVRRVSALCAASVVAAVALGQSAPNPAPAIDLPVSAAPATKPADTRPAGARSPSLLGEDGRPVTGVRLMSADVKAIVRGPLAEAVMVLTFRNDLDRVLGGELTFPLPDGASVVGYGLDVNGTLVDGVAVEKQQARVIYEKEMNKSVDPGLVEHVTGNNFRTRLYPIPAKGTRTIKIHFVADLIPSADGRGASLSLPMGLGDKLEALDLTVAVEGATEPPSVKGGSYTSRAFEGNPRGFYLRDSLKDVKALDALTISLPETPASQSVVQRRQRDPVTLDEFEAANRAAAGRLEHYFVLTDAPARPVDQVAAAKKVQRVLLVWDASLSRVDANHDRELKLIEQTLVRMGRPVVDLTLLRNNAETIPFAGGVEGDNLDKLLKTLRETKYDGATNLAELKIPLNGKELFPIRSRIPDYDLALVFTDGLGTIGGDNAPTPQVPTYAISSAHSANHALLRQLCRTSGGLYTNLNRESDDAALDAIAKPPFSVIKVECDPAKVADVTPGVGTSISGRVTVAGRLLAPEATVTLVYGFGKNETSRRSFTLRQADATEGLLVPRFWAQQKANELMLAGDAQRDELVKLGKSFNLVTPATSLLVLETAEQYVQHGIVPPKTRPEIYQAFSKQIENRRVEQAKTKEQKIEQVLAMWDAKKKWFDTKFEYPADFKVQPPAKQPAGGGGGGGPLAPAAGDDGIVANAAGRPTTQPGQSGQGGGEGQGVPRSAAAPSPTPAPLPPGTPLPVVRSPEPRTAADPQAPAAAARPMPADQSPRPVSATPRGTTSGVAGPERDGTERYYRESGGRAQLQELERLNQRDGEIDRSRLMAGRVLLGDADRSKDVAGAEANGSRVQIQAWDPKTPYLAAMKAVKPEQAYDVFLAERPKFAKSPAFYLDCADYLLRVGQKDAGVRVLTDVVELKLEDARLIRVAAHRLQQVGELDLAIGLFERVAKLRPEEPQSFRDLALALAARADWIADRKNPNALADATGMMATDYARAIELLNKVVTGNWDRFQEIELIALTEANAILAKLRQLPNAGALPVALDPRLQKNLDCDVRIVLTWDADMTDIDLWVTEPSGETCRYDHNRTHIGGLMSRDFTQGYGPEEYLLRKTMKGTYKIQANFYGSRQQELTGACTVQATVITNFGRADEKREQMTLRLATQSEVVTVGTIELGTK